MRPDLTVTTNPTIDVGNEIDSLRTTGKCRVTVGDVAAGGGGINVARTIVELGGSYHIVPPGPEVSAEEVDTGMVTNVAGCPGGSAS